MGFRKTFTTIFLATMLLLWAVPVHYGLSAPVDARKSPADNNYALIIGIGNYKDWSKLESPVSDAEKIVSVLTERYNFRKSRIKMLTDRTADPPTLLNILTQLDQYQRELTDKDNLLIFFSGHGTEDDDGETYWVPIDGKKKSKLTWLSHKAICEDVLSAEKFKAKNLLIITDSVFSSNLLRKHSISLSPYDLRYEEKIVEMANIPSREIISFGDQHWPASPGTDNMGLFAYHIRKALSDNPLEIIDFENLLFDENVLFPITKIAGTRLLRGRLKNPLEQGGQFLVRKVAPAPLIDILRMEVSPEKGYPGDGFTVRATTSAPADEVFVEYAGKRIPMQGRDTEWSFQTKVPDVGSFPLRIAALNKNAEEGKAARGFLFTVKPKAPPANVVQAQVSPDSGLAGDDYRFSATTSAPAKSVEVVIGDQRFPMEGSGTSWTLQQAVDLTGTLSYSISAINSDGVRGEAKGGTLKLKSGPTNVIQVAASPETGYAGEEFTLTARTDRPASSVIVQIDGRTVPMTGSGRLWRLKQKVTDVGEKSFSVVAKNEAGTEGSAKSGRLVAKKTPLPIPDVASVNVKVVPPGTGYAGDRFEIAVQTSAPSQTVLLNIDGKERPMEGAGTQWKTVAKIDGVGSIKFQVVAKNPDGMQGQSKEGEIQTQKRPSRPVTVLTAEVSPKKGIVGQKFVFRALTDGPSKGITIQVGKSRYEMEGAGSEWILEKAIEEAGEPLEFSLVARNEDNVPGTPYNGSMSIFQERYRLKEDGTLADVITGQTKPRFVDNGDGTITDLATSLMWMQQPKQIATDWDNAVEYCRTLNYQGLSGWRLPTIGELEKLVDNRRQNPALPAGHPFANVITHLGYWSKSRHKFGPQYVYQMSMWYGKPNHMKKTENALVWPVRYVELNK